MKRFPWRFAIALFAFGLMVAFTPLIIPFKNAFHWVALQFLYRPAELPEERILHDLPYGEDPRQKLDLFVPAGVKDWPILIFVPGGGWTTGDKGLTVAGYDVYGNIGRFFAASGIGVAVINYRLIPGAHWREQIEDVARATAWIKNHISHYGGDPKRIFLSGHSAGAQLVTRVAVDPKELSRFALIQKDIRGVIAVSGAGYDMADEKTYELGADPKYYSDRFGTGANDDAWKRDSSPLPLLTNRAPPFLVIYADGETKPLKRQSQLLHHSLAAIGVKSELVTVPGEDHERMVLVLSRGDKPATRAMREFILAQ